ncbi:MAG: DNA alkylation repair protein [Burkholderiaceae bacterium]
MAEAFKNLINTDTVCHAADHLQRVCPAFDRARFIQTASRDLSSLEFKARALRVADGLDAAMPVSFADAADALEHALAPPLGFDDKGEPVGLGHRLSEDGLSGWVLWGAGEFVVRRGMNDLPRALACLHALTQRFTAEFALRPFIDRHPEAVLPVLKQWVGDPSAHVRRLTSEGSRPRLPWGLRLQSFVADPSPTLPLLLSLQDDPSSYVRRSVANHLNDIAKDHPDVVASWVQTHLPGATPARTALLRHASRSLIKQGHGPTLHAWGLGQPFAGSATVELGARRATVGDGIDLHVQLCASGGHPQELVIDYVVHHVRANGSTAPKVFKGWKRTLLPGETIALRKRHSLKEVTTRQLHAGHHRIALQINGKVVDEASFELLSPHAAKRSSP